MLRAAALRPANRIPLAKVTFALVVSLLASATPPLHAQSFAHLLQTKRPALGVVTAIQEPGVLPPAATLRAQRVSVERQKRGLFRVALLPTLVLEDATIELRNPTAIATCIHRLAADLANHHQPRAVEFRRLTLRTHGPSAWTLQAAIARPEPGPAWTLERVTWHRHDGLVQNLPLARLVAQPSGQVTLVDPTSILPNLELAPPTSPVPPPTAPTSPHSNS